MEMYQQMIIDGLARGELAIVPSENAGKWVESQCYRTLERIREILADDTLEDPECFQRIEEIVLAFEEIGCPAGSRHDFG